jgi:hypothetical protein
MRRKSPSIWKTTQYAILAHFGISSQTWNEVYARKSLVGLRSARQPIHETSRTDMGNPTSRAEATSKSNCKGRKVVNNLLTTISSKQDGIF